MSSHHRHSSGSSRSGHRSRSRSRSREREQSSYRSHHSHQRHGHSHQSNHDLHNSQRYNTNTNYYSRYYKQYPTFTPVTSLSYPALAASTLAHSVNYFLKRPIVVSQQQPHPPSTQQRVPSFFCSGCAAEKPTSDFSQNQRRKNSLVRRCKVCIENNVARGKFVKNAEGGVVRASTDDTNNNSNNNNELPPVVNDVEVISNSNNNNNSNNVEQSNSLSFECNWCDQSFANVTALTIHCNTQHFHDTDITEQKNQENVTENQDKDIEIKEEVKEEKQEVKKKKKEVKLLPIDGRWIVYYSDTDDIEPDNDYNKMIKHRYKMDLETVPVISSNDKEENDKEQIVNGHCVKGSGDCEWRFLLKGTLDENNNFLFTMKGRTDIIYGKARFDGKDSLKRGSWYENKKRKKECGILSAQRDTEYDQTKEEDTLEKILCVICMENECCVACVPCGHTSVCRECVKDIEQAKKCPFCAMPITGVMNIYISGF